jgi:hypothetical protein
VIVLHVQWDFIVRMLIVQPLPDPVVPVISALAAQLPLLKISHSPDIML